MKNNENKKGLKWLLYLILGGFLVKLFRIIFKGDNEKKIAKNFKDFFKQEKREVEQLKKGSQSFKKYCEDSCSIFASYFIPTNCNDHKPKILRTKPLLVIAISLLLLKGVVAGYLFSIYPDLAKMSVLMQDEVFSLVNVERNTASINFLTINKKLNDVALVKAEDMIRNNYFAHKGTEGEMVWDLINRDEYPYLYVGENLAMNFTSAQSAHKALMLSPSHKKNILNPRYREIGIAVVPGEINNQKTNILVQVFAQAKEVAPVIAKKSAPLPPVPTPAEPIPSEPAKAENIPTEEPVLEPIVEQPFVEPVNTEPQVLADENQPASEKIQAPAPIAKVIEADLEILEEEFPVSPNEEMETHVLAYTHEVSVETTNQNGNAIKVINYSQYIFIGVMIFLIITLLMNIIIRVGIQHKPVIIQTLLVILFIYGLINVKFHFLENITEKILLM